MFFLEQFYCKLAYHLTKYPPLVSNVMIGNILTQQTKIPIKSHSFNCMFMEQGRYYYCPYIACVCICICTIDCLCVCTGNGMLVTVNVFVLAMVYMSRTECEVRMVVATCSTLVSLLPRCTRAPTERHSSPVEVVLTGSGVALPGLVEIPRSPWGTQCY